MTEGASLTEIEVEMGICADTRIAFEQRHPEFAETIKKGKQLSKAWWLKLGRKSLRDKDFNYGGWFMNMKNRFQWADRNKQENSGNIIIKTVNFDGDNNSA